MRKLLLGVLLLPALALAEPVKVDKPVVCDKASDMLSYFGEKYGERPFWMGDTDGSKVLVLTNAETKTWTVVQFNMDNNIACFIESGTGFRFKLPGDPT